MTERALDRDRLFEALTALRDARDPSAHETAWAWKVVDAWMDHRYRRPAGEHDDVRQRALIKVMRGIGGMKADTPPAAEGWLRRVHGSAVTEHHRGLDAVASGLKSEPRDAVRPMVERLAAPTVERSEEDQQRLDAAIAGVLERVERWLAANVKRADKRIGDRRRAECALMANVMGLEPDQIAERVGVEVSKGALYKWIERGRENVLIPALEQWRSDAGDEPGAEVAGALLEILVGSRRADAGRPRPDRRSVSRGSGTSSSPPKRPRGPRRS